MVAPLGSKGSEIGEGGSRGALLNVIVAPLKRGLFVLLSYAGMLPCARVRSEKSI